MVTEREAGDKSTSQAQKGQIRDSHLCGMLKKEAWKDKQEMDEDMTRTALYCKGGAADISDLKVSRLLKILIPGILR